MRVTLGFLALACAMGATTHATAALVYSDTLAGAGLLNGSAPDTVNVPAATWFANDGTSDLLEDAFVREATGTTVGLDGMEGAGAEGSAATLPITLSPGNIYTASVTVEPIEGGNWMYLSFVNTAAYNVDLNGGGDGTDQPRALALVVTIGGCAVNEPAGRYSIRRIRPPDGRPRFIDGAEVDSEYNVTQTAAAVGFESLSHFNATFRSYMGVTPGTYLKRQHQLRQKKQAKN